MNPREIVTGSGMADIARVISYWPSRAAFAIAASALATLHKICSSGGCTHLARRLSSPPLECMGE